MNQSKSLSREEKSRYLRHILLDEINEEGQVKLKNASVLCVGAGGLGSPALLYLAAAGVGRIGIVDSDTVDESNLQRQVIFSTGDVGRSKVEAAKEKLLSLNPYISIETFPVRFEASNAERLLRGFDAIMDGTDNFSTRYLVNDVATKLGKPNFFGCIFKFTGQVAVFGLGGGCYRCLFPAPPSAELAPDCARAGVLGVLPGIVGAYQALEFLKWKLEIGESLSGKLMTIDTLKAQFKTLSYSKNSNCPTCKVPEQIHITDYDASCMFASSIQGKVPEISVQELQKNLRDKNKFCLLDVRDPVEHEIGHIGGILIPLDEFDYHYEELPTRKDYKIVIYCRSGMRSARACELLMARGYTNVYNVTGGILAWKSEIDSSVKV